MTEQKLEGLVVGSGIAGLAAAVALEANGIEVTIADPKGANGGSMGLHHHVTLWGNGASALESVTDIDPSTLGLAIERFEHRTANDELIWKLDCADLPGGVERTRFIKLDGLRNQVRTTLKATFEELSFERFFDDDAQVLTFAKKNGRREELTRDLLIGAAGKNDPVRKQLLDDDPIRYLGQTLFVGWYDGPSKDLDDGWWAGLKSKQTRVVGFLGDACWLDIAKVEGGYFWIGAVKGDDAVVADLLAQIDGFPDAIRHLVGKSVSALRPTASFEAEPQQPGVALTDVIPAARPTRGGVALLGDAVHGVTLIMGQSVGLALEDAAVLKSAIAEGGARETLAGRRVELRKALAEYGRRRASRPAIFNHASHWLPRLAMSKWIPEEIRNRLDRASMPLATRLYAETLLRFAPERPI